MIKLEYSLSELIQCYGEKQCCKSRPTGWKSRSDIFQDLDQDQDQHLFKKRVTRLRTKPSNTKTSKNFAMSIW